MTNEELLKSLHRAVAQFHDDIGFLLGTLEAKGQRQEPEAPAAPEPAKVNLEQVRAAMTDLASAKGADAAKSLLKEYGAKKLGDVDPAKYASLLTDAKAWANE